MSDQAETTRRATGSVAIVTGGGSGIGRASAVALSSVGWSVVVAGRTAERLEETVAQLTNPGLAVTCDVADEVSVDRLFAATVDRFGRVDLLFNNAGTTAPPVPIDQLDVADWRHLIDVNLTGSFLCARAAFAQMRRQRPQGGRIINNGSISSVTPRPFSAPYTASKHAITGLTKSLSLDGRDLNIACGQIDIGNALTDLLSGVASPGDQQSDPASDDDARPYPEATMDVRHAAEAVVHMASLPPEANVLFMTIMANTMPFVGRG